MVLGSQSPSMGFMQDEPGLMMFKGAPASGNFPATAMEMEMHGGMTMNAVAVQMVAKPDGSNNYHFMPHVAWVEPGTTLAWMHADIEGVSQPRGHSVTAFGAGDLFPKLQPEGASTFDSGYIPGLHGEKSVAEGIDERYNDRISDDIQDLGNPVGRGPFMHTFETEGVHLYYCQNHHGFMMAAAVVVGELYGDGGTEAVGEASGWSPAMTMDAGRVADADPTHGDTVAAQVRELRGMVQGGGMAMGHDGGGH
jgi:plastocyanin